LNTAPLLEPPSWGSSPARVDRVRSPKSVSTLSDLERRRASARASAHAADGARNRDIALRTAEQLRALTPSGHG
jgi:hypothetical protein